MAIRITKHNKGKWRIGRTDVVDRLQWPGHLTWKINDEACPRPRGLTVGGFEVRGSKRKEKIAPQIQIALRYKKQWGGLVCLLKRGPRVAAAALFFDVDQWAHRA